MRRFLSAMSAAAVAVLLGATLLEAAPVGAVEPGADPFFSYSGATPLASYSPGAVLATRTVSLSLAGLPTPVAVVQVLYRSTDQLGRPIANVTSVFPSTAGPGAGKAVSYQSFYDSLNPADSPSRAIAGGMSPGGAVANVESAFFVPFVLQGYAVIVTDTEGPDADFAAGPEYGQLTLDGIRAASTATGTGLTTASQVGMLGYSGGAIATGWAAALAPTYAPDVNARLVGATEGGVLVAPAHNLRYIDGTPVWGGVEGMALVGIARAFDIDFSPYLSDYGTQMFAKLANASIGQVLGQYPDFRFARLVKPQYAEPTTVKPFVDAANAVNIGSAPTPTIPMQIRQGAGGDTEGTPGDKPGIGPGDGVMIAGDVRALARQYCDRGATVDYAEYAPLSHVPGATAWLPEATAFLTARFAGTAATDNCSSIAAGNSLAPEVYRGSTASAAGPSRTRTRVRLPRVWQVRGEESTRLAFAVVSKRTSDGAVAGRVVIRIDGHKWRSVQMPVTLKQSRKVIGHHVRLPTSLGYGSHRIRLRFKPAAPTAFTPSTSRAISLEVVGSRP